MHCGVQTSNICDVTRLSTFGCTQADWRSLRKPGRDAEKCVVLTKESIRAAARAAGRLRFEIKHDYHTLTRSFNLAEVELDLGRCSRREGCIGAYTFSQI